MLVFIEGPDGSGKSTLIKQLSEKYIVSRVPRAAEESTVWNFFKRCPKDITILFDRSPITEVVYRTVDKNPAKFSYLSLLGWLRRNKVIFCNNIKAFENAITRGEDNITDKKQHSEIAHTYQTIVNMLRSEGYQIMDYDWQEQTLDDVIKFIEGGNEDDVR